MFRQGTYIPWTKQNDWVNTAPEIIKYGPAIPRNAGQQALSCYTTVNFLSEKETKNVRLCQNNKQHNHIGLGGSDRNGPLQHHSLLQWIRKHQYREQETSRKYCIVPLGLKVRWPHGISVFQKSSGHLVLPVSWICFISIELMISWWAFRNSVLVNIVLSMGSAICLLNAANTGW